MKFFLCVSLWMCSKCGLKWLIHPGTRIFHNQWLSCCTISKVFVYWRMKNLKVTAIDCRCSSLHGLLTHHYCAPRFFRHILHFDGSVFVLLMCDQTVGRCKVCACSSWLRRNWGSKWLKARITVCFKVFWCLLSTWLLIIIQQMYILH